MSEAPKITMPEPTFLYDPMGGHAYSVEQVAMWRKHDNAGHEYTAGLFTAAQLLAAYLAGMEAAAQIVEQEKIDFWNRTDVHDEFTACAAAIRRAAEGAKE